MAGEALWVYLPLVAAIGGAAVFAKGCVRSRRRRNGRRTLRLVAGAVLFGGGVALSIVSVNQQRYVRFQSGARVADIFMQAMYPSRKAYFVTIKRLDGSRQTVTCIVKGDSWRIVGRRQEWHSWGGKFALGNTYSLERFTTRINSPSAQEIYAPCDISGPHPKIDRYLPISAVNWLVAKGMRGERDFSMTQALPLAEGAKYRLVATETGLTAEAGK